MRKGNTALSKFMEMKMQKEVHYTGKIYYHGLEIKRTSKMWYDTNYQTFYLTFKYVIPNIKKKKCVVPEERNLYSWLKM